MDHVVVYCSDDSFIEKALENKGFSFDYKKEDLTEIITNSNKGIILSDSPKTTMNQIQEEISSLECFQWKDFDSKISHSAKIHDSAVISSKNVIIGDNCEIGAFTTINEKSIIGKGVKIAENTIISSKAFDVYGLDNSRSIVRHSGGVLIEDYVEILSFCTITRATYGGFTKISRNSKIDSHVHIAHDCVIDANVTITAFSTISGNTKIGKNTYISPHVAILQNLSIGEGSYIGVGSVVVKDVEKLTMVLEILQKKLNI